MAASYLKKAFDPAKLRRIALETYRVMQTRQAEVIVARGLSGIVVATACGALFNAPFAIVRKENEGSHSGASLEVHTDREEGRYGSREYNDWLIVDDFIVTGLTMDEIGKAVARAGGFTGRCVGIALYNYKASTHTSWRINGYSTPAFDVGGIDE